ncbi:MAG: hypothetical protein HQ589_01540 [Syntrophaceae bacterium]|nr:hypothetical protein [Syntrophaceae bacterium]
MTHSDKGNYSLKHPPGTTINQRIAEKLEEKIVDGKIDCAAAHKIAEELGVKPEEVGVAVDLLEVRIGMCQLGLFGYGVHGKIVEPAEKVSPEVNAAVGKSLMGEKLSCLDSWKIAEEFGVSRMEISAACEKLKIKISSCQIGSF